MTAAASAASGSGRRRGRPFEKGCSGNPMGRAVGSRPRALAFLDKLGEAEAEAVVRTVAEAAKAGDMGAASILLARIWPPRRERPVRLELPSLKTARDAVDAAGVAVQAMARGEISPGEAVEVTKVLAAFRDALALADFEARLNALEAKVAPDHT